MFNYFKNISTIITGHVFRSKIPYNTDGNINLLNMDAISIAGIVCISENDIKKIRDEVSAQLKSLGEQQNKELDNLVKVYSTSKPKSVANIITTMDVDTAVAIFSRMTPNVAGKILNELGKSNPEYASKMAERLTYQPVFGDDKKKAQQK